MAGEDVDAEDSLGGGDVGVEGGKKDKQGPCDMHDVGIAEVGIDLRAMGVGMGEVRNQLGELEVRLGKTR